MSLCYWVINGIGINSEVIAPYLNRKKLVEIFYDYFNEDELKEMIDTGDYSNFDMEEYFYGNRFEHLADVLWVCDDTDTLTYGSDGEGNSYFYYPPSMPWHHVPNEPKSEQEVVDRIVMAVQKIADMTREEIEKIIDHDLYVVCCG